MKSSYRLCLVLTIACLAGCARNAQTQVPIDSSISLKSLRCEYHDTPVGIDVTEPRLSWVIHTDGRGFKQTAYHIVVASTAEKLAADKGDLWDSHKVNSDATNQIVYAGKKLKSNMKAFWKVRIWDGAANMSPWSKPASWSMGLLSDDEWKAQWIGDEILRKQKIGMYRQYGNWVKRYDRYYYAAPHYRKEFSLAKPIKSATLYATARGLYEMYLNGEKVGRDCFTPGWTVHEKRLFYQAWDVTDTLKTGDNAIGAIIGDGWYVLMNNQVFAGQKTGLLAQLRIEYTDGSAEVVTTDDTWKLTMDGPIIVSDIYNGEEYDARKELEGWAKTGYDDKRWEPITVLEDPHVELIRHPGSPIQATRELKPIAVTEPTEGAYVIDMGQNMVGWVRLKVTGEKGTKVRMRFAEMLNDDGTVYLENMRSAKVTDYYTLKGDAQEIWQPRFTYHGFRYVEITGYPGEPDTDTITGIVLRSNAPITSTFECSNPMLNKLYENIMWGQCGNYWETPTDCPQRDERLGWTGDSQVFIRTGAYNMDVAAFFTAWLITLNDNQYPDGQYPVIAPNGDHSSSSGWSDAGIICPWVIYTVYGDTRVLERHYDDMAEWIAYMKRTSRNLVRTDWGFGDWLNLDGRDKDTPLPVINTAYFAYSTSLMAKVAQTIGKDDDAARYRQLFADIKKAFNDKFVKEDGTITGDTQTAYLLALRFNLLDDPMRQKAAEHLIAKIEQKDWHLSSGFLGVNLLLPTLTEIGRLDVAYRLLQNETYPSWLYSIHQGATTIWERWNSYTKESGFGDAGMNSFNHYAYGSCGQWMFSTMAGIAEAEPGFRKICIRPRPGGGIEYVKASYSSINGRIATDWKLDGDKFTLDVTIPPNTTAHIYVPAKEADAVTESGRSARNAEGLTFAEMRDGAAVFEAGSGRYHFESQI